MWLIVRIMLLSIPAVMVAAWPVAFWMRQRAYGSGGARRAPGEFVGTGWQVGSDPDDSAAT
jgi:hypothetical protein